MAEDEKAFQSQKDPDWLNKTRTLIVSSRGITSAQRQFILSVFGLLPHAKKQFKLEKNDVKGQIEQLCEAHKTRYFMYFEVKKKVDFSLWIGRYPEGPSIKFGVQGILHSRDIKFQGNSVKGARHVLSFDGSMKATPKMRLARELLIGALNVPKYHPKSTAVVDHVLNFVEENEQIHFKNFQILRETVSKRESKIDLHEIGPRFILSFVCILEGVLAGQLLYRSPIIRKYLRKAKKDDRKVLNSKFAHEQKTINIFGQEQ